MTVNEIKLYPIEKEFADLGYYEKAKHTRFKYLIASSSEDKGSSLKNMFFNTLEHAVRAVSEIECGDDIVYEIGNSNDIYTIYIEGNDGVVVYNLMPYWGLNSWIKRYSEDWYWVYWSFLLCLELIVGIVGV